jgi:A/G-specific adenine glycosylase
MRRHPLCAKLLSIMVIGRELRVFRKSLLAWFRKFQRELPWRKNKDAYRVWLSEIMLQQTRVAVVIPYYERFLERFPTLTALAEAPTEEVLRFWSGLGYYTRARNLQRAAQQIVANHAGRFPESRNAAMALPGIGAYTSAAILSIAFEQQHAVLDGNVARVVARLFALRGDLREPDRWKELQCSAVELLARNAPGDWNQAMMELGATICTPRSPQCLLCPVAKHCAARKQSMQDEIPEKRKKRAPVTVTLAAAVFVDPQGRSLLLPPPHPGNGKIVAEHVPTLVSNLWHFPTIAVTEDPGVELAGHLQHTFALGKARPLRLIALNCVKHSVTYRKISIFAFRVEVKKLPMLDCARALELEGLSALPVSSLTRKIARAAAAAATK